MYHPRRRQHRNVQITSQSTCMAARRIKQPNCLIRQYKRGLTLQ
ncbi:hypothetical protein ACHAXN_001659 [Cyclotella atomus]